MRLFTVDPGTKSPGWAVWDVDDSLPKGGALLASGYIRLSAADTRELEGEIGDVGWLERMDWLIEKLWDIMVEWEVEELGVEHPEIYASGVGAAANNSGSVMKLCAMVYSIRQACIENGVDFWAVPVSMWKGQVDKQLTVRRVKRAWGWEGKNTDESDAVGIGDWYIRKGGQERLT